MRIDVKKYLFIGNKKIRNAFFEAAQEKGIIHFIDADPDKPKELPLDVQHIASAIKILRGLPPIEQEEINEYHLAEGIAEKILHLKHQIERYEEEKRVVKLEIARIEIFGDFSLEDIAYIENEAKRVVQFFCAKKGFVEDPRLPETAVYVGTEHGLDYFISINKKHESYEAMMEMKIEQPLGKLAKRYDHAENEIDKLELRLKDYAKYNQFLHHALIALMNRYHLEMAENNVEENLNGALFVASGWVPKNKVPALEELVRLKNVHYEEIAQEEGDDIPTYLENHGPSRMGEDLVHIYDTPSIHDKDPSLWVLFSFALFFAFIVGDGGYGLIFLAVAAYLQFKFRKVKKGARRLLNLVTMLCLSTVLWGFLTTSFFGISFGPDSPMQKASLVNWLVEKKVAYHQKEQDQTYHFWTEQYPAIAKTANPKQMLQVAVTERNGMPNYEMFNSFSDAVMLEMALLIGMIHISLSFLRYLSRNWAGIGWVIAIIGGYLYFPYYLKTASMLHYLFGFNEATIGPEGLYFLVGGLSLALILSLFQNKLYGLLEITTVVQVFGDILSYLRLYALGLAGGIVSATVNELAGSVFFAAGLLILIFGHIINMILCIMGGVIHGLRLNFIEWYHYSFDGGGKLFNPLRKLEVD